MREITTVLIEIKNILREYYGQWYTNKLGTVDEMEKLLERHKLMKLTQEEIENMNWSTTSKELKLEIKILFTKEAHSASLVNSTKY